MGSTHSNILHITSAVSILADVKLKALSTAKFIIAIRNHVALHCKKGKFLNGVSFLHMDLSNRNVWYVGMHCELK